MSIAKERKLWRNSCERVLIHHLAEVFGLGVVSFICDLREDLPGYYHILFLPASRMNEFVDQFLTAAGLDVRYLDVPLDRANLEAAKADAVILWDADKESYNQDILSGPWKVVDYRYYLEGAPAAGSSLDRRLFPPNVSEANLTKDFRKVNRGRTIIGLLCGRATPEYLSLADEAIRKLDRGRYQPVVMQYDDKHATPEYTETVLWGIEKQNIVVCPYRLGSIRDALRYTAVVISNDYRIQAEAGLLSQPVLPVFSSYDELSHKLDQLLRDRRQLEQLALDSRLMGCRRSLEVIIPRLESLLR